MQPGIAAEWIAVIFFAVNVAAIAIAFFRILFDE